MNFVMNEKKYAEELLNGEGYGENYSYTTAIMAKYYKRIGYNNREIKVALERLLNERVPFTAPQSRKWWVKRALDIAEKYPLYELDEITVTKSEMEKINTIHSDKFKDGRIRRLAFTLLCFAKFESARGIKDNWVNIELKHIFSAADLKGITKEKQRLFIHELYKGGFISINPVIGKFSMKVLFTETGETELTIQNINEAGKIFRQYNGEKFIKCQRCGKMVAVTNGRSIYCAACAVAVNREKTRERMKKISFTA